MNTALSGASTTSMVSPNFLQFTSGGQLWGLNFREPESADVFCKRIASIIAMLAERQGGVAPAAAAGSGVTKGPTPAAPEGSEPGTETAKSMMAKLSSIKQVDGNAAFNAPKTPPVPHVPASETPENFVSFFFFFFYCFFLTALFFAE